MITTSMTSSSAWRMWIEITMKQALKEALLSSSAWRMWIEISTLSNHPCIPARSSSAWRMWIEILMVISLFSVNYVILCMEDVD